MYKFLQPVVQLLLGKKEAITEVETASSNATDDGVDTLYKNGVIHHPTRNVIATFPIKEWNEDNVACVVVVKNNKYKGNIPTILFFMDKFPHQFSTEDKETIYEKCVQVCPDFTDVLKHTIYAEGHKFYDRNGIEHTIDEFMEAPLIGIFSLYELDSADSLPKGWSMKYNKGAKERLKKLFDEKKED